LNSGKVPRSRYSSNGDSRWSEPRRCPQKHAVQRARS
jgi:hypothetical protein